jgi:prolyl-tRNA synthetase
MIGGLIMAHGDDRGLVLPPRLAPTQCVVLLVKDNDGAGEAAARLTEQLRDAGLRVHLDDRVDTSFGRRATDWELKGIPLRIEVGPRDLAEGNVTVVWRHLEEKTTVATEKVVAQATARLDNVHQELLDAATARRDANTFDCTTLDEIVDAAQTGFVRAPWSAVGVDGEAKLAKSAVSVRCLQRADGAVPETDDEPDLIAYCARAY